MRRPGADRRALAGLYESVMRALARVVTDRRWAAPLSAMALCFGLFLGVAIGPGVSGSAAGGAPIIALAGQEGGGGGAAPSRRGPGAGREGARAVAEPAEEASEPLFAEEAPPAEGFGEEPAPEDEPEQLPPPREDDEGGEETEAVALRGTVVRANPLARSYTLAAPGGELVSVHAPRLPAAGTRLEIEATPLPNNTFAERSRERSGRAGSASFAGVVTYADPDPVDPVYTVSGRGSSLLVHADPARAAELPVPGAYVKVTAAIEPAPPPVPATEAGATPPPEAPPVPADAPTACLADPSLPPSPPPTVRLRERRLEVDPGEPATYVDLAGVVLALCPESGQVLLSADDLREGGAELTLAVPASISTHRLAPGEPVLATAERDEAGALTLAGLAGDRGRDGAEDARAARGDLAR